MTRSWPEKLAQAEYGLLCALALVLPIFEAPKNLFVFLLMLMWTTHRIVSRDFALQRPDAVGASLLFLLAATVLSTATNWPFANGLKGFKDVFVQCLIFWMIYRARFTEQQQTSLAVMIALGVMAGLVWGVADVALGRHVQLQFHSAGVVTQSALYLGIAFVMTLSIAWHASDSSLAGAPPGRPVLWWVASAVMMGALFLMGSRGPLAATIFATLLLVATARRMGLAIAVLGLLVVGVSTTAVLSGHFDQERALSKTREMLSGQLSLSDQERYDNWRIAIRHIAQGDSLVLGIGPRNFSAIDHTRMQFDPPLVIEPGHLNHAHNLFLTKLVEEGIVGLASLLLFLGIVIARLVRDLRDGVWRRWQWFAATGAIVVPVIAGSVNTPWYQEHALLAMMVLATCLAPCVQPTSVKSA